MLNGFQVTGIKHLFNFEDASVAQKMSWAAKWETFRLEDQAYCLMGIFGVSMPSMYGEEAGAFLRLQLEIMRISNDESLFAREDYFIKSGGPLAPSPLSFKYASDIKSVIPPRIERPPSSMTNQGVEISLYLREWEDNTYGPPSRSSEKQWLAPLSCACEEKESCLLSVLLSREVNSKNNYQRVSGELESYEWPPSELPERPGDAAASALIFPPFPFLANRKGKDHLNLQERNEKEREETSGECSGGKLKTLPILTTTAPKWEKIWVN